MMSVAASNNVASTNSVNSSTSIPSLNTSTRKVSNTSSPFGSTGFGCVVFFEHVSDYKFRQSTQGILFIIFANGETFFYPLNDQTKGTSPVAAAKMLTTEGSAGRKLRAGTQKHFSHILISLQL